MTQSDLTKEQQKILGNIDSLQKYYRLDSHSSIVRISLSRKMSDKLFSSNRVMIASIFEEQPEDPAHEKYEKYAEKYTYQRLIEKFQNCRGTSGVLKRILMIKIRKEPIGSHNTRKQLWLLASGAKAAMHSHKNLYQRLLQMDSYPDYFSKPIDLDLYRTVLKDKQTGQDDLQAMRRVLIAFSRRNPFIGYCQGLNFIANFILIMQFNEQEAFWLLSYLIENIIPMDYYTNMLGVVCDQRILAECIKQHVPKISKKFQEVGLDPSVFSIQWFVCIFCSSMPFYLVKLLWDRLIIEGTSAIIKCGLILLEQFQQDILKLNQFPQIILLIEERTRKLPLTQRDFNSRFDKIYLNRRGLKLARQLYRQHYLIEKLAERAVRNKPQDLSGIVCDPHWPICIHSLERAKRDRKDVNTWILRQKDPPNFIKDYCDKVEEPRTRKVSQRSESPQVEPPQNLVIGRMVHVCHSPEQDSPKHQPQKQASMLQASTMGVKAQENLTFLLDQSGPAERPIEAQELLSKLRDSSTVDFFKKFVRDNKELGQIITQSKPL